MTLLHYASKSGAAGIGDAEVASKVVTMLLSKGADPNIRCRWTNMTALHYASYFDVVPVIKVLLKSTKALGIDILKLFYDTLNTNIFPWKMMNGYKAFTLIPYIFFFRPMLDYCKCTVEYIFTEARCS